MVKTKIKIKEKSKSFIMNLKISKKEVQGRVFDSEDLTELKRIILEEINYEVDNLINKMVEDEELTYEQIEAMESALSKVSIAVEETEEVEEEVVVEETSQQRIIFPEETEVEELNLNTL
jgi:hypothetical protein